MLNSPASVGSARRTDYRRVAASSKSAGRVQSSHVRCAYRLRMLRSTAVRFSAPDLLLRRRPAEGSRGALMLCRFGFRQVRQGFKFIGIPPA
nr:putative integron gene cassette protein [uncultured bacterium]